MARKVVVRSLGCKLNQFEAELLLEQFLSAGWKNAGSDADVCIINTCTVTGKADRKSRNLLRRLAKENPRAKIVVTGCYATTDPEKIVSSGPVDLIVPNEGKSGIFDLIGEKFFRDLPPVLEKEFSVISSFQGRERPFVKIQDGCDGTCTYCKVRFARGPSISVRSKAVLEQIRSLSEKGYKEVVLTGVNIMLYQENGKRLPRLLREIFDLDLPLRVRLASIEPQNVDEDFLRIIGNRKLCDHFHFALQTGSQEISKMMNRNYSPDKFRELVRNIRRIRPESGIGIDIITGFPGETDNHFSETCGLIEDMEIPFMHIFRYSDRKGTAASDLPDKISEKEKMTRGHILQDLNDRLNLEFRRKFIGKVVETIVERRICLASNYLEILPSRPGQDPKGALRSMRITHVDREKTCGEFI